MWRFFIIQGITQQETNRNIKVTGMEEEKRRNSTLRNLRNGLTLILAILGIVLMVLAVGAEGFGLGFTPGFGIVQMTQLLVGLTCLTLACFVFLRSLRPANAPKSLQADIALRLVATGLVFAYISGLADLISIGTHTMPRFERPYVGPFQLGGLILSVVMISLGLLLYHTSRGAREQSSMKFMINGPE